MARFPLPSASRLQLSALQGGGWTERKKPRDVAVEYPPSWPPAAASHRPCRPPKSAAPGSSAGRPRASFTAEVGPPAVAADGFGGWDVAQMRAIVNDLAQQGLWDVLLNVLLAFGVSEASMYNYAMTLMSSGSQWQMTLHLLEAMCSKHAAPDVISYVIAATACKQSGHWQLALWLISVDLPQRGLQPDTISFNVALSAIATGSSWALAICSLSSMQQQQQRQLGTLDRPEESSSSSGSAADSSTREESGKWRHADVNSYKAAISACARAGRWHAAVSLMGQLLHMRTAPDIFSYSEVISSLAKLGSPQDGSWETALALLGNMPQQGVVPNRIARSSAISALAKHGKWTQALQLQRFRRHPDRISSNAVITACANAGQWQVALRYLEAMDVRNCVSYNAALSALEKGSQWPLSLRLLSNMKFLRCEPDEISYNSVVSAAGRHGKWELALRLLAVVHARTAPNSISCNAAISACEKGHQWQAALGLLSDMPQRRLAADAISFSSAICASESACRWELSLDLIGHMFRLSVHNTVSFNAAISALGSCSQWRLPLQLLRDMSSRSACRPDEISCNAAISSVQASHWPFAIATLSHMQRLRLLPNLISRNAVMSSLSEVWTLAMNLLREMREIREGPDEISYNAALSACGRGGQWRAALALRSQMPAVPDHIGYRAYAAALERSSAQQAVPAMLSEVTNAWLQR
ncbi:unnamed protein product, partial [Polarella glacialis]